MGLFMNLDPAKPVAAFIEYTLKPVLEDMIELIELMDAKGYKRADLETACRLFIFQVVMDFIKSIVVTGLVCWTLYLILSNSQIVG